MSTPPARPPQRSLLFRLLRFLIHPHSGGFLSEVGRSRVMVGLIVFTEGCTALAVISIAAYVTRLPLLFPPLGPTAFILLRTPMAESASPRSVIRSHCLALVAGLLSVHLFAVLFPEAQLLDQEGMSWPRIGSLLLSMGLASAGMIAFHCSHPPAAATAIIAGMGVLRTVPQVLGLVIAVFMLVAQALVLHRLLSGLPYPAWRYDAHVAERYGPLAGLSDAHSTFWGQLTQVVFSRRIPKPRPPSA